MDFFTKLKNTYNILDNAQKLYYQFKGKLNIFLAE